MNDVETWLVRWSEIRAQRGGDAAALVEAIRADLASEAATDVKQMSTALRLFSLRRLQDGDARRRFERLLDGELLEPRRASIVDRERLKSLQARHDSLWEQVTERSRNRGLESLERKVRELEEEKLRYRTECDSLKLRLAEIEQPTEAVHG
jgi:hypothetical protein